MASRKENIKALFDNTRSRIIIIFTGILLILAVIMGLLRFTSLTGESNSDTQLMSAPSDIRSIPGSTDPTEQYAALQAEQNVKQAEDAAQKGGSAIPTIIRTQAFGEGVQPIGPNQQGNAGLGFEGLALEDEAGPQQSLWMQQLKDSGCSKKEIEKVVSQGASLTDLKKSCSCQQLKESGYKIDELKNVCSCPELRQAGFVPHQLKKIGFNSEQLRDCGFNACQMRGADFTAKEMKQAGYSDGELKGAGFPENEIEQASQLMLPKGVTAEEVRNSGCDVERLRKLREANVSALAIIKANGCTAKQLKDAGYDVEQLKNAGLGPKDLLKAGFNPADLRKAGFTAKDLNKAGVNAKDLKNAGYDVEQLKNAGLGPKDLLKSGFAVKDLKNAGYSDDDLQKAGLDSPSSSAGSMDEQQDQSSAVTPLPSLDPSVSEGTAENPGVSNARQLQDILKSQQTQMAEQRYQQKIQDKKSTMLSAANEALQDWKSVTTQVFVAGNEEKSSAKQLQANGLPPSAQGTLTNSQGDQSNNQKALIKTGDILFAVLDTSVNSDEPGPILATIVSGKFKGAKLIGSFNLPSDADKMVINFNTMSVRGASKTTSINAYAIDPNTARTAIASYADHHYLMRYGSLFASTFLEGFGNAFQSANTTITIGGTGGTQSTTVESGVGRSLLENAVIGLATVGKNWGQVAQKQFSRPITVQVNSGTGLGILFTQDVTSL